MNARENHFIEGKIYIYNPNLRSEITISIREKKKKRARPLQKRSIEANSKGGSKRGPQAPKEALKLNSLVARVKKPLLTYFEPNWISIFVCSSLNISNFQRRNRNLDPPKNRIENGCFDLLPFLSLIALAGHRSNDLSKTLRMPPSLQAF